MDKYKNWNIWTYILGLLTLFLILSSIFIIATNMDDNREFFIIWMILSAISGIWANNLALDRAVKLPINWFFGGFLFSWITIFIIMVIPKSRDLNNYRTEITHNKVDEDK